MTGIYIYIYIYTVYVYIVQPHNKQQKVSALYFKNHPVRMKSHCQTVNVTLEWSDKIIKVLPGADQRKEGGEVEIRVGEPGGVWSISYPEEELQGWAGPLGEWVAWVPVGEGSHWELSVWRRPDREVSETALIFSWWKHIFISPQETRIFCWEQHSNLFTVLPEGLYRSRNY